MKNGEPMNSNNGFVSISTAVGPTTVCEAESLSFCCNEGWRVIGTFTATKVVHMQKQVPDPHANYGGASLTLHVDEPQPVQMFLLTKTEDQAREETLKQMQELRDCLGRTTQERIGTEEALSAVRKEKDVLSETVDRQKCNLEQRSKDLETERAKSHKLEGDIGKLRTAIGELRMKEILEPTEPAGKK